MPRKQTRVNATGWRAVVKRWRRNNRRRINALLTRLFGTAVPRVAPLDPGTRRVLVVRLNKRLGNILFLTPLLRSLAAGLPDASIDVLIQDARQRPLLESLPAIGRVWIQDNSVSGVFRLARDLRRERYDLAIDPTGNSTSNRVAMALCGARQRMGFAGSDQWLRLTHAAPSPRSRHQARQALELLTTSVEPARFEQIDTLAVFPAEQAQAEAMRHWAQIQEDQPAGARVVGFFAEATGHKQLPASWWLAWHTALAGRASDIMLLRIRAPGPSTPLLPNTASLAIPQLDVLAALIARMDVFIAADSGPMHLAAAAGVPVVGLFRATDPRAYAPLGRGCTTLSGDELTAEAAADTVARILAHDRQTVRGE